MAQDNSLERKAGDAVVLDTNAVLDWLVFDDSAMRPVAARIETRRWHWVAGADMMDEFSNVLARPALEPWRDKTESALGIARSHCMLLPSAAPSQPLHCTDPEDQKFIDFAVAHRVQWLFTRDKALLRLARRAAQHGVTVLRPSDWRG